MKAFVSKVLVLLLLPCLAAAGDKGKVQIITSFNNAAQCISPVHIRKIDGKEAAVQSMGFNLEPGMHTLSGSAVIDVSNCLTLSTNVRAPKIQPLEADFVAGKVYYVGYDHSARDRKDWKLVIWKVEDAKS
jgi:hypothetical protein